MARVFALSDKTLHAVAGAIFFLGLIYVVARPLRHDNPTVATRPSEFSLVVETHLPADLKKIDQATIHLPDLPLSVKLEPVETGFHCQIKSLAAPHNFQVTLYLKGGEQAIARGHLIERGPDRVAVINDWHRLSKGGSQLAQQASKYPVSQQWQRPELVTPRAEWLGRLEVRRNLPPHRVIPNEPGGHHHP